MDWKERLRLISYKLHDGIGYKPKYTWEVRLIRTLRPVGRAFRWIWNKLKFVHILIVTAVYIVLIFFSYKIYKVPSYLETLIGCPTNSVTQTANSVVKVSGDSAVGSAFWLDNNTLITNNHVVDHNKNLKIVTPDNTEYQVKVLGTDSLRDIAVLSVANPPVHFTPEKSKSIAQLADDVFAVGYPEGRNLTVTKGIVSAFTADDYDDRSYIQTDAAINFGNSGGVLVDTCGRVIGMNTQILAQAQNISFAINADQVYSQVSKIVEASKGATPQEIENSYPSIQAEVVAKYYTTLGGGDLEGAYSYFSKNRQARLAYDGWQGGLKRTISIRLISVGLTDAPNTINAHFYTWESKEDNPWEYKTGEFEGTWTLVRESGLWKMDTSNIKDITPTNWNN